jgi:hypothetical protein
MLPALAGFSIGRVLGWLGWSISTKKVKDWVWKRIGTISGLLGSLSYTLFPGLWEKAYEEFQSEIEAAAKTASGPAAAIVKAMTGMPVSAEMLAKIASGGLSVEDRYKIGDWFVDILDQIFLEDPIKQGYLDREPGTQERIAFRKFVGRNAQLQLAGVMIDLLKDRLPQDLIVGLGEIAERMEKILGFEDSQEEIMEPLMEKIIISGMEQRYNRIILPTDLTPGDATEAEIRGWLKQGEYKKILDNAGIRLDVREHILQLRAKMPSESDIRDYVHRGVYDNDQATAYYRRIGYLSDWASALAGKIVDDRTWKLREELLNVKESQFVAGVLDEGSLRNYLATMHYSNEQEDIAIEIAKGKASMTKTGKPKQITGTFNVAPWRVKPGNTAMMSWNIRNATDITISGIGAVGARGERVITPDISQTYYLDARSDTDEERFEAAVQVGDTRELKRPTATFSASPGRIQIGTPVELKWITGDADTISIEGIGPVAESGALAVYPFLSTVYTLRATNAQGTTVRQDIVFVEPPDFDFDKERRPGISFSITPTVVKASQPQAELNWSIARADEGRLTFPDGSTQNVSQNGALIVTATASGIYTLKASNLFGETQNQEALIFQGADEEVP